MDPNDTNNDTQPQGTPEDGGKTGKVDPAVQALIDREVAGLKQTNADLKTEKTNVSKQLTELQSVLDGLGGLETLKSLGNADTIKQLAEMQERFKADEQGKLLTEGKYDEWFDRRTEALRRDHENQISQLNTQLEEAQGKIGIAETALRHKVMETEVSAAAVDAGVEATAMIDVQLRAANAFTYDPERDRLVLKDEDGGVVFGKDGNSPKSVREWLEDQKETSRHWWPPSQSGGAEGSGVPGKGKDLGALNMRDYEAARRKQGFKSF